ncbi:hypothetical protein CYMTET_25344 [Cymbomonas tetramitiformis]|uniref:Uncharacterized protein n=1 Tax=Cymbomonas tetramitiformis TaxID=36881 RepID=A0AAE0FUE1_9CHLO|nr:hypothetical protein CYMTET_25344 [Cymbomonas tetramitiformis]
MSDHAEEEARLAEANELFLYLQKALPVHCRCEVLPSYNWGGTVAGLWVAYTNELQHHLQNDTAGGSIGLTFQGPG